MANFTIKVKGLSELIAGLEKGSSLIKDSVGEAMRKSTELVKQKARRTAGSPPIVFRGELARSIQATVSAMKGKVVAGAKHAPFVEFGTRPHFPPVAPLERWAATKLGSAGLGFVIARKIAERGTKAQPFFEPAVDDSLKDIERFFGLAVEKVVDSI